MVLHIQTNIGTRARKKIILRIARGVTSRCCTFLHMYVHAFLIKTYNPLLLTHYTDYVGPTVGACGHKERYIRIDSLAVNSRACFRRAQITHLVFR